MVNNINNVALVDLTLVPEIPNSKEGQAEKEPKGSESKEIEPEIITYILKMPGKKEKSPFDALGEKVQAIRLQLKDGKINEVNIDAIQALANELLSLSEEKNSQGKAVGLLSELQELAEQVAAASYSKDVKQVALVGDLVLLSERAKTYAEGNVKNGLMKLDQYFVMRSIRGDGHCLFRATLVHLLKMLFSLDEVSLLAFVRAQDAQVEAFKNDALTRSYKAFKADILEAYQQKKMFLDLAKNQKISDEGVQFLRQFVCEYHRQSENDVFAAFVASTGKTKEAYLEEMVNMERAAYGDHPEVNALSILFQQNITVADVATFGKYDDEEKRGQSFSHFKVKEAMTDLFLIHRPNHYDLGYLRDQLKEGEMPR